MEFSTLPRLSKNLLLNFFLIIPRFLIPGTLVPIVLPEYGDSTGDYNIMLISGLPFPLRILRGCHSVTCLLKYCHYRCTVGGTDVSGRALSLSCKMNWWSLTVQSIRPHPDLVVRFFYVKGDVNDLLEHLL